MSGNKKPTLEERKILLEVHKEGYEKGRSDAEDGIFREIQEERKRADRIYGENRMLDPYEWYDLIREELIEAIDGWELDKESPHDYRTEMIQTASLVIAAIESWDRGKR